MVTPLKVMMVCVYMKVMMVCVYMFEINVLKNTNSSSVGRKPCLHAFRLCIEHISFKTLSALCIFDLKGTPDFPIQAS